MLHIYSHYPIKFIIHLFKEFFGCDHILINDQEIHPKSRTIIPRLKTFTNDNFLD